MRAPCVLCLSLTWSIRHPDMNICIIVSSAPSSLFLISYLQLHSDSDRHTHGACSRSLFVRSLPPSSHPVHALLHGSAIYPCWAVATFRLAIYACKICKMLPLAPGYMSIYSSWRPRYVWRETERERDVLSSATSRWFLAWHHQDSHTLLANACMHLCRLPAISSSFTTVLAAAAASCIIVYVYVYICVCVGILMMLHWRSRAIYPTTQISSAIFLSLLGYTSSSFQVI